MGTRIEVKLMSYIYIKVSYSPQIIKHVKCHFGISLFPSVKILTYMGACVTYKYSDLLDNNFKTALIKAKQDMERWSTLPLSLAGRINSVKMLNFFQF